MSPRFCFSLFILNIYGTRSLWNFIHFIKRKLNFSLYTNDRRKSFINRWKIRDYTFTKGKHRCPERNLWTFSGVGLQEQNGKFKTILRLLMDFCTRFSAFLLLWVRAVHTGKHTGIPFNAVFCSCEFTKFMRFHDVR